MKNIVLDLDCLETREEIHSLLKKELDLPEYYGNNLDALYDCLTELQEDTVISICRTVDGSPVSAYLERMQRVFKDAEEENPHLAVFFFTEYASEEDF